MPEKGALRVWRIVNPPRQPSYYPVNSVEQAKDKIAELASADLKNDAIYANAFGLELYEGEGRWEEWESPEGYDISTVTDADILLKTDE